MSLPRHALVALLIATVATVAGIAVWTNGRVDLGLRLETVEGVGEIRAKDIREGLRRLQEINLVDRYLQT